MIFSNHLQAESQSHIINSTNFKNNIKIEYIGKKLTSLEILKQHNLNNIVQLDISKNNLSTLSGLPQMQNLQNLSINYNPFQVETEQFTANQPNLKNLMHKNHNTNHNAVSYSSSLLNTVKLFEYQFLPTQKYQLDQLKFYDVEFMCEVTNKDATDLVRQLKLQIKRNAISQVQNQLVNLKIYQLISGCEIRQLLHYKGYISSIIQNNTFQFQIIPNYNLYQFNQLQNKENHIIVQVEIDQKYCNMLLDMKSNDKCIFLQESEKISKILCNFSNSLIQSDMQKEAFNSQKFNSKQFSPLVKSTEIQPSTNYFCNSSIGSPTISSQHSISPKISVQNEIVAYNVTLQYVEHSQQLLVTTTPDLLQYKNQAFCYFYLNNKLIQQTQDKYYNVDKSILQQGGIFHVILVVNKQQYSSNTFYIKYKQPDQVNDLSQSFSNQKIKDNSEIQQYQQIIPNAIKTVKYQVTKYAREIGNYICVELFSQISKNDPQITILSVCGPHLQNYEVSKAPYSLQRDQNNIFQLQIKLISEDIGKLLLIHVAFEKGIQETIPVMHNCVFSHPPLIPINQIECYNLNLRNNEFEHFQLSIQDHNLIISNLQQNTQVKHRIEQVNIFKVNQLNLSTDFVNQYFDSINISKQQHFVHIVQQNKNFMKYFKQCLNLKDDQNFNSQKLGFLRQEYAQPIISRYIDHMQQLQHLIIETPDKCYMIFTIQELEMFVHAFNMASCQLIEDNFNNYQFEQQIKQNNDFRDCYYDENLRQQWLQNSKKYE